MSTKPPQFESWPATINPGFGPYRAVVQSITDGDTFRALIDHGFNSFSFQPVRLLGIDAPEVFSGTPEEREKGRAARSYLESIAPPGTKCLLRTDKDRQSFGRYIAGVLLADGTDLASAMVGAGHARWSSY